MNDITDAQIGVKELEEFFKKYRDILDEYDKVTARKSELYKELTGLELRAVDYLKSVDENKTDYRSMYGTFAFRWEQTVKTPKTIEAKEAFSNWLKERGLYEAYKTFNSMSVNSLYKSELEATGDPLLEIPGLEKGQPVLKTSFRRS